MISDVNITEQQEDNFSVCADDVDIWPGYLPFTTGSVFPTEAIRHRANISKTNRLIFESDTDDIFNNLLSVFPEMDPMYGWQIREIVCNLPTFKNATNSWVGLIAGSPITVDTDEDDKADTLSSIVEQSNLHTIVSDEVRSRFLDIISAYLVTTGITGKPLIVPVLAKNLICFVSQDSPSEIQVNVVFSIYKDTDGKKHVDFVEYHYNGFIKKSTFAYDGNILGELEATEESLAFDGLFRESPIVVFKHNTTAGKIYGTDQYRYWSPSILAGMRSLQNVLRLGERTREIIRKVPETALSKDNITGSSTFVNRGTVTYKYSGDGNSPAIEYLTPDLNIDAAIKVLDAAIKEIGTSTGLGFMFFNAETMGSRLSADSLRAAMYPARLEAQRICTEMRASLKELVIKLGYLGGLSLMSSKLNIEFSDGLPKDEAEDIKSVQLRLDSNHPSITLEDAIMKLDHVSARAAKKKADEIRGAKLVEVNSPDIVKYLTNSNRCSCGTENMNADANGSKQHSNDNNTVWSYQMPYGANDQPQGVFKEFFRWLGVLK